MNKKNILLGVTGSVAIYKSCYLARMLIKEGFSLKVVMTPNAVKLVSPVLFQALTGERVYSEMFQVRQHSLEHISLSKWSDLVLIAPVSANTLAKIACGLCDNLLTSIILALPQEKKVVLAPAMNTRMWVNSITQNNIEKITRLSNYTLLNPSEGRLACGDTGQGALVSLDKIITCVKQIIPV
jgi:phosphopantothenoylcysteine decarboxylase / phosphopantothenate---cysteine ligase